MTLTQAIERNRRKQAKYRKAERILRQVRLRIFDYEDAGKLDKANRIIEKCKTILAPLWETRTRNAENRLTQNYMV